MTTVRPGGEPLSGEESETGGVIDGGGELAVVTVKSPGTIQLTVRPKGVLGWTDARANINKERKDQLKSGDK